MRYETEVGAPDVGRRVDRVVAAMLGGVPPSLVQRLLRKGKVRINGQKARPGDRLALGEHTGRAAVPGWRQRLLGDA